ncbi:MAG TPA: cytochrome c [Chitinophagales bacterium]|nr:cytochrome c [Chitinophagales bacterium]
MKKKINLPVKSLLPASLVVLLALFIYSCGNNNKTDESQTSEPPKSMIEDPKPDDGQGIGKFKNVELGAVDEKKAANGQTVFEAKCSACHNTTDVKKVGPGLAGITQRRQAAWILNMITNPQEMTQKDPTGKKLLEEHLTQMTFQDVSDEQAKEMLEYFRQQDAGGAAQAKK